MCTLPLRSAVLTVVLAGAILSAQLGVQGAAAKWQFELAQHDDDVNKVDGVQLPRRRYSHSATVVGSEMVVTHGYFFDHTGGGGATWIDDTWAFTLDGGENQKAGATSPSPSPSLSRWREVKDTTANAAATTKPHARMSHTAVERDGKLVLFGGDDGGHLKGNSRSYKGTYLDDLWELDVTTGAWSEIKVSSGDVPPPRAHHAAVVLDGKMVVYAGMHLDDVWNFDFESRQWSILYKGPGVDDVARNPGKRHGLSMAPDSTGAGFYMFGGFVFKDDRLPSQKDGSIWGPLQDLWHFDLPTRSWRRLEEKHPIGGRTYAPMYMLEEFQTAAVAGGGGGGGGGESSASLILFGGAACKGTCTCFGDTWSYSLGSRKWIRLTSAGREPITRYKHSMVYHDGRMYSYGGESYKPYMYHNSVQSLDLAQPTAPASNSKAFTATNDSAQQVVKALLFSGAVLVLVWVVSKVRSNATNQSIQKKR